MRYFLNNETGVLYHCRYALSQHYLKVIVIGDWYAVFSTAGYIGPSLVTHADSGSHKHGPVTARQCRQWKRPVAAGGWLYIYLDVSHEKYEFSPTSDNRRTLYLTMVADYYRLVMVDYVTCYLCGVVVSQKPEHQPALPRTGMRCFALGKCPMKPVSS